MVATPTYNPVNFSDPTGESLLSALVIGVIVGTAIGGALGGAASYYSEQSSNLDDRDLFWTILDGVGKGVLIGGVAGGLVGAAGGAVSVYGAASVAATAVVTATATAAAKATEVTALQAKKSIDDGDNGWQIADDCIDSTFNNIGKIIAPVALKSLTTGATYFATNSAKHKLAPVLFDTFLHSNANQVLAYGFVTYNWCETVYSILCVDQIARANQRGYRLK